MMDCQANVIKHMLHWPILSRRIGEWAYTLIDCDLALEPSSVLKGQILVNLFFKHGIDLGNEINNLFLPHGGFILINWLEKRPRCWHNHYFLQWCCLRHQAD